MNHLNDNNLFMKLNLPSLKQNHENTSNYSPRVKVSTKKYEVRSKSVFAKNANKFSDSSYKNFIEYNDDAVMFSDVHLRKNNERHL